MLTEAQILDLKDQAIDELANEYIEIVGELVKRIGISPDHVAISRTCLSNAFYEAQTDLKIMSLRRRTKSGISASKVAGIVAFRLCRFSPVNVCGNALEHEQSLKLNEMAALASALKSVLHVNIADVQTNYVTMELQYSLVRRHMNQETLGLAFEAILRMQQVPSPTAT